MKMKKICMLIATASIVLSHAASASDGTITINGKITDVTCAISVNGGTENATVTLPTVSQNTLTADGDTAGTTPFDIKLTECQGSTLGNAYAYFESGTTVDTVTGRLNNTGTAANVQVELLDKANNPVFIGSSSQGAVVEDISSGSATLVYAAQYYSKGSTGSGTVTTQVDYTIAYD
ncbi:fimbrial protein [Enterobacillus tribolii]|uniref:Major type 1 subunit fimbrin (Pilin) n=1 Tax=Enterobacillus tribolii TaxID=1487935 RepID=A0A370QEI4_9GAMM|nr:fimbrial protein [Enterobacillus tribolii]MBW7984162.1 type 1 fimbrial protein [Enterobacillus tribolii]RDK86777.1 major type 1 subunit fimbrin (pilin) [Enterobacillus tribolii]